MNKRKKYTPAEKAQIVLEVLREEETLAAIANKYDVCQQLISRWKSEFLDNMATVFDKKNNETFCIKGMFIFTHKHKSTTLFTFHHILPHLHTS